MSGDRSGSYKPSGSILGGLETTAPKSGGPYEDSNPTGVSADDGSDSGALSPARWDRLWSGRNVPLQRICSRGYCGHGTAHDDTIPPTQPEGDTWRYGLGLPFQVAAGKVGLFCGIRGKRGHDFEAGTDVILFSDLSQIQAEGAIPISRNHNEKNPNSSPAAAPSIMVKYPVRGGFVPAGAKLEDGSPHPHAGTGFGICQAIAWTEDQESVYPGEQMYEYVELYQLAYDDGGFRLTETERIPYDELFEGAVLANPGLTNAIADGEDLLFTMGSGIEGGSFSGLTRWRLPVTSGRWTTLRP